MSAQITLNPLTDLEICILIDEVKKQPCLYIKNHPKYIDYYHRKAVWNDIAKKVFHEEWPSYTQQQKDTQVEELSYRWKTMRASFIKELRTRKMNKSNGRVIAFTKYDHFKDLMFLKPHVWYRVSDSAELENTTDSSSNEDDIPTSRPSFIVGVKTYSRSQRKTFQVSERLNKSTLPVNSSTSAATTGQELPSSAVVNNMTSFKEESLDTVSPVHCPIHAIIETVSRPVRDNSFGRLPFDESTDTIVNSEAWNPILNSSARFYTTSKQLPSCSANDSNNIIMVKVESLARSIKIERSDYAETSNVTDTLKESPTEATIEAIKSSPDRDDLFEATEPTLIVETRNPGIDSYLRLSTTGQELPSSATDFNNITIVKVESLQRSIMERLDYAATSNAIDMKESLDEDLIESEKSSQDRNNSKVTKRKICNKKFYRRKKVKPKPANWKRFVLSLLPTLNKFPDHKIIDAQIAILSTLKRHLSNSDDTNDSNDKTNIVEEDGGSSSQNNGGIGTKSNKEIIKIEQSSDDDEMMVL